ncbi:DNA-directed RNA polymerase I subunit RPA2, partial [Ascosphaera pollenicola]
LIKTLIELFLQPASQPPLIHFTSSAPSATTVTSSIETSLAAVTSSYVSEATSATHTPPRPYVTYSSSSESSAAESSTAASTTSSVATPTPEPSYSQSAVVETPVTSHPVSPSPTEPVIVSTSQAAAPPPASTTPAEGPQPAPSVSSSSPVEIPAPAPPVTTSAPSSTPSSPPQTGGSGPVEPRCYRGDEFPAEDQWASFDTLFNNNKQMLQGFNSDQEIEYIRDSIEEISTADGVNESLLFAIMLEESRGDCHVVAGDLGKSVGILQVHGCTVTCHDVAKGQCSAPKIKGMIDCGVQGTDVFQGFKGCLTDNNNDVGAALRCYNSGSVPDKHDLTKGAGRASYVSDVGNWVVGVQPPTDCGF